MTTITETTKIAKQAQAVELNDKQVDIIRRMARAISRRYCKGDEDAIASAVLFCVDQWRRYDPTKAVFASWAYTMCKYGALTFIRKQVGAKQTERKRCAVVVSLEDFDYNVADPIKVPTARRMITTDDRLDVIHWLDKARLTPKEMDMALDVLSNDYDDLGEYTRKTGVSKQANNVRWHSLLTKAEESRLTRCD